MEQISVECTTEKQLVDLIASPEGVLKVVRYYTPTCPACIATLPEFERLARDWKPKGVVFATIDVNNVLMPKVLPTVKFIPAVLIFRRHAGCVMFHTGARLGEVEYFLTQRM